MASEKTPVRTSSEACPRDIWNAGWSKSKLVFVTLDFDFERDTYTLIDCIKSHDSGVCHVAHISVPLHLRLSLSLSLLSAGAGRWLLGRTAHLYRSRRRVGTPLVGLPGNNWTASTSTALQLG